MSSMSSDEIISILKEEIENYDDICKEQETGTVISVGDGIARIYGMDHAMYGEVITFECGLKGMVQDSGRTASAVSSLARIRRLAKEPALPEPEKKLASPWEMPVSAV